MIGRAFIIAGAIVLLLTGCEVEVQGNKDLFTWFRLAKQNPGKPICSDIRSPSESEKYNGHYCLEYKGPVEK